MLLTYDDANLYVGFIANEPNPEKIIERSLIRDKWYGDDYVTFHIDPNLSKENSLTFSVYPAGAKYDMAVSNDAVPLGKSTFNDDYDMIWKAKTSKSDSGWQIEMQIPISNLRLLSDSNGFVKAGISGDRSQNYLNKDVTTPTLPQGMSNALITPSLKREILFENIKPRKQLQITPYMLGLNNNKYLPDSADAFHKNNKKSLDVGMDIRYGITPKLTVDLTYNTDFAQVEIDEQIVNIGDRANIYLPEKRKFFQEQAGNFDFNQGVIGQLFYSRSIGVSNGILTPIIGGARLTGKIGSTQVGLLSMQTDEISLNVDNTNSSENFSVIRLKQKIINDKSFIGFMTTNRIRLGYYNTAAGIDGVLHLSKDRILMSSIAATKDKYDTTQTNINDHIKFALQLIKRKKEGFFYTLAYEYSGDNFNPGMGFVPREKHQNLWLELLHGKFFTDKEKSLFKYRKWRIIGSDIYLSPDLSKVITWYNRSTFSATFFSGDKVFVFVQPQYEYLTESISFTSKVAADSGSYFYFFGGCELNTAAHRFVGLPVSVEYGSFYKGQNFKFSIKPSLNISKHLIVNSSWRSNYLVFDQGKTKDWLHIAQLNLNWALNLHFSGSIIAQFNSMSEKAFFSLRFRYNFSDGHDIYLVLNQDNNVNMENESVNKPVYNNQNIAIKYIYTFHR